MNTPSTVYRLALALALGTALFLALGIGALGVIGAGGRADRWYLAVFAVIVLGSIASRLRPAGMARTMVAAAVTQVLVPVVVLVSGRPEAQAVSLVDVVGLTGMYAGLFLLSAWLFRRSVDLRARAVG